MSTVYLHVGQCGIQVGQEFWGKVSNMAAEDVYVKRNLWSHGGASEPRALFIDAERKVVNKFSRETKKIKHGSRINVATNSITTRRGCGANFALGYNKLPYDITMVNNGYVTDEQTVLDACMGAIRVKVERCDAFAGFLGVHSTGGGTGAGFGARLCQELNDEYPTAYRLWNVITPHSQGESPTQHYNQLLSISKIHENSDAIVLFHNDVIMSNETIADTMMSMFLPVSTLSPSSGPTGVEPWELLRSVAPIPSLKLLQTSHLVSDKSNDPLLWENLTRSLIGRNRSSGTCISSLCICRGIGKGISPNPGAIANKLKKCYNFVKWNPFPIDVWLDRSAKRKSITLCSNLTSSGQYMRKIIEKCRPMFDQRAYLHWYSRFGVHDDDFYEGFEILERVADGYREAES